jgi:hypothetical protein
VTMPRDATASFTNRRVFCIRPGKVALFAPNCPASRKAIIAEPTALTLQNDQVFSANFDARSHARSSRTPMKPNEWMSLAKDGVAIFASLCTLGSGLLIALWAYTKYILERGLLPAVQMDLSYSSPGKQGGRRVCEISIQLKNLGTATLIAKDIRLDVRYSLESDPLLTFTDASDGKVGRLHFPHRLVERTAPRPRGSARGLLLVPYDTFVQPSVNQFYPFISTLPKEATFVLVWASFHYAQRIGPLQDAMLRLSRHLGLIQYSLSHLTEDHTIERVFAAVGHANK